MLKTMINIPYQAKDLRYHSEHLRFSQRKLREESVALDSSVALLPQNDIVTQFVMKEYKKRIVGQPGMEKEKSRGEGQGEL